jgi:hypothetical protein
MDAARVCLDSVPAERFDCTQDRLRAEGAKSQPHTMPFDFAAARRSLS